MSSPKMVAILELRDRFTGRINRALKAQQQFKQMAQQAGAASKKMGEDVDRASRNMRNYTSQAQRASRATLDLGRGLRRTGNDAQHLVRNLAGLIGVAYTVRRAWDAVKATFADSIQLSMGLESSIASAAGLARATPQQQKEFKDIARRLSLQYNREAIPIAELMFTAIGSGFGDASTADLEKIARVATVSAAAAKADPQEMMKLLAAGLNAYYNDTAAKVANANRFMDIMFRTIDVGVVEGPELAQHLGNVMGTAAQIGLPWEDLGASMSLLTRKGISAPESVTAINRLLLSFMKPSNRALEVIDKYGLDFTPTTIARLGFSETLRRLAETFNLESMDPDTLLKMSDDELEELFASRDATASDMVTLFGDVRGLKAFLGLGARRGQDYAQIRREMEKAPGAMQKMLSYQERTFEYQYGIFKNMLQFVKTDLGDAVIDFTRGPVERLNQKLRYVLLHPDYEKANIFTKMHILGLNLTNWVEDWFWGGDDPTGMGPGKEKVTEWGRRIGQWLGEGIKDWLTGFDEDGRQSVFIDIGKTAWQSFKDGFTDAWDWSALIPDTKTEGIAWGLLALRLGIPQALLKWIFTGTGLGKGGEAKGSVGTMHVTAGVVYVNGAVRGGGRGVPTGPRPPSGGGTGKTPGGGGAGKAGDVAGKVGKVAAAGSILSRLGQAGSVLAWLEIGREFFVNLKQPADKRWEMSDGPFDDFGKWLHENVTVPYILNPLDPEGGDWSAWKNLLKPVTDKTDQVGRNQITEGMAKEMSNFARTQAPVQGKNIGTAMGVPAGTNAGDQMVGGVNSKLTQFVEQARGIGAAAGAAFASAFNSIASSIRIPSIGGGGGTSATPTTTPPSRTGGFGGGVGAGFAKGGDVPYDGPAYLHYREMVLPREYAEVIREMAAERSGRYARETKVVNLGGVKLAETVVVRNESDIDQLQAMMADLLETYVANNSVYAAEE